MPLRSLLIALFLVAPALQAQTILPAQFAKWSSAGPAQATPTPAATKDVFAESGLQSSEVRTYSSNGASVTVTLYRFRDPSGAYEAYSAVLTPESAARNASDSSDNDRFVLEGNILLAFDNPRALSPDEKKSILATVGAKSDKTPPPPIPDYLPDRDRVAGSAKYALGPAAFRYAAAALGRPEYAAVSDVVGFSSGAEVMFAQYHNSRDDAVLLLIDYPTPQLAGLHWKHLEQSLPASAKATGTTIERKGTLLAIVLSPSNADYANRVRNAVNYETQVTWNEPTHTITDPPITTVLAKIIIATGVFMLVAIVFGIAFGGVRVLMKALFPGKIFDRPEQMDVLQLGLSGKRIKSRDFY
jgi:hypothetical protein